MPKQKRYKTTYPGVFYIIGRAIGSSKPERIYYVLYRKDGKLIEDKVGRQFKDNMTPAKAAHERSKKIGGETLSNRERREAEEAEQKAQANIWTIQRLWKEYKENKPNLKGIVTDENRFENYIRPRFGNKEPIDLSPLDIDRLRITLLKKRKPATVRNVLELLRRIINFGVKKHLCQGIGFKIEMPKVNNLKTEDLNPEQLSSLLKAIEEDTHPHAGPLMLLALYTGMRRGELFRLKWRHIDFERGFIHLKDPKGGPDEKIPLNDAARKVLDNHAKTEGSPYVFPGKDGGQRVDIKKQVNRIKERAGLGKSFRALHGLRHVFASGLASSGRVDLYHLQKLLTHKSASMVQRYAHLADPSLAKASQVASEIFTESITEKDSVEAEK